MCCLFGLIDYGNCLSQKQKERIIRVLSRECEARGTDATGIAYMDKGKMKIYKRGLPAHRMRFKLHGNPPVIMGHTRWTTQGSEKRNFNNHPFYSEKVGFALAHNGVLYNDTALRKSEGLPETNIETDSYIALQLIESKNALNFETIKYMAEKVDGSFCFTMLNRDNELYIVKGDNPMCIAHFPGLYIYASTDSILNKALKKLGMKRYEEAKVREGEILKFDCQGEITRAEFSISQSYGFYGYPCYVSRKNRGYQSANEEYLRELVDYGKFVGIDEELIMELLDNGYDFMDIEELLYEADFYGEDDIYAEI